MTYRCVVVVLHNYQTPVPAPQAAVMCLPFWTWSYIREIGDVLLLVEAVQLAVHVRGCKAWGVKRLHQAEALWEQRLDGGCDSAGCHLPPLLPHPVFSFLSFNAHWGQEGGMALLSGLFTRRFLGVSHSTQQPHGHA